MDSTVSAALIGASVGVITTYLAAVLKLRSDLRFEFDKDLREKRITHYEELWRLTGAFPKYGPQPEITYGELRTLTSKLRDWYFSKGGMFLSNEGRAAYFYFQERLRAVLANPQLSPSESVDNPTYERLRNFGSDLRTALVKDVGTRKQSELSQHEQ